MNFLLCSLMLVKISLGVILLRTAWRYYDSGKKKQEKETSKENFYADDTLQKRRSLSNIFDAKPQSEKSKSRSLSDIERFTLCSNRII